MSVSFISLKKFKHLNLAISTSGLTDLSVAVLASLGGGHLDDLAGSALQHNEAVFTQGRALHGEGGGCPGITRLEVQVCICHACCGGQRTGRRR